MRRHEFLAALGSAAIGASLTAHARVKTMPVIGFLHSVSPVPAASLLAAFKRGLGEAGFTEGQNVEITYRWAEGHYDRLPAPAAQLVDGDVDVIVAGGGIPSARAAKDATSTIPIVFTSGVDPVAAGLVASLSRPGGNITGVSLLTTELNPKRIELLSELLAKNSIFAFLLNPGNPNVEQALVAAEEAAQARGVKLLVVKAGTEAGITAAFESSWPQRVTGLIVGNDPFFFSRREQIVTLASRFGLPAIYPWSEFAAAGGLISYGPNQAVFYYPVGAYVGRILRGEKPADLPVQQPTKFELVINLKTAKALGLTVPQSILARADEVIE